MINKECPRCGFNNSVQSTICTECKFNFNEELPIQSDFDVAQIPPSGVNNPSLDSLVSGFSDIGDATKPTLKLYKDNFPLIAKIVLAICGPLVITQYALLFLEANILAALMEVVVQVVSMSLLPSAMVYGLVQYLRTGNNPTLKECYSIGLKRFWVVLLSSILISILMFFGLLLLVIPGIIVMVTYSLVYPAIVFENEGVFDSMKRSANLTKGYRGRIFIAYVILGIPSFIISTLINWGGAISGEFSFIDIAAQTLSLQILQVSSTILSTFIYLGILANQKHDSIHDIAGLQPLPIKTA
jgi:uncharacterized membrane protein